jgi:hypothetical protein
MAYQAGDSILDDHYNGFVSDINAVWNTKYGQSALSTVSAGSTITATQWSTLLSRITSCANHQSSSITSITSPVAGNTINYHSALTGNISTINTNNRNAAANGTDITAGGAKSGTATWYTSSTVIHTITFSSSANAEEFFNAGGLIRVSTSRSGGTSNSKNTEWTDLCSSIGNVTISGGLGNAVISGTTYSGTDKVGGGGNAPTIADNTGYHDLTGSYISLFKQFADTSPYTSNYIEVSAYKSGATIYVKVYFVDAAADTLTAPDGADVSSFDKVDGTLTSTLVMRPPSTTYITNNWGTPSMSATIAQS